MKDHDSSAETLRRSLTADPGSDGALIALSELRGAGAGCTFPTHAPVPPPTPEPTPEPEPTPTPEPEPGPKPSEPSEPK